MKPVEVWLAEQAGGSDDDPVFPTSRGDRLSRDALEKIVRKYTVAGSAACPSLLGKRVTPHVLRHSTAMELLQSGVDQAVIALLLGHESVETTQVYVHADLRLKEKALARIAEVATATPDRYQPGDATMRTLCLTSGMRSVPVPYHCCRSPSRKGLRRSGAMPAAKSVAWRIRPLYANLRLNFSEPT